MNCAQYACHAACIAGLFRNLEQRYPSKFGLFEGQFEGIPGFPFENL